MGVGHSAGFEITGTWSANLLMPTEMRISVSENFKIDGGSVFCFSESKKSGGEVG
jgi:hypothetical protein